MRKYIARKFKNYNNYLCCLLVLVMLLTAPALINHADEPVPPIAYVGDAHCPFAERETEQRCPVNLYLITPGNPPQLLLEGLMDPELLLWSMGGRLLHTPAGGETRFVDAVTGEHFVFPRPDMWRPGWVVWSLDDRKVAYSGVVDENSRIYDLFIARADGSSYQKVTDGISIFGAPSWSPNSSQIVFAATDADKPTSLPESFYLFTIDVDGTNLTNLLPDHNWRFYSPGWSPDGQFIAFSADQGNANEVDIYILDVESGALEQVTEGPGYKGRILWTADSTHIYYQTYTHTHGIPVPTVDATIERLSLETGESTVLVSYPTIGGFDLSRDERHIVYTGGERNNAALCTLHLENLQEECLDAAPHWLAVPRFQPG